ncbi:MAG TPA: TetR family transcriptional regulator [Opitutaceae bacterium]
MSPLPSASAPDTRDRILDTAERLFAAHGFDGTSLRQITEGAEVNLAAVNYHFGSKEELYTQVFIRRIVPINVRRMEMLDTAVKAAGGRPVPVRAIFESFARPVFEMADRAPGFLRLLGRNVGAPPAFMAPVMEAQFRPLITRYVGLLQQALPHLTPKAVFWRMHFMVGATLHCASHHFTIDQMSGGLCHTHDVEEMLQHLSDFAVAGIGNLPERNSP